MNLVITSVTGLSAYSDIFEHYIHNHTAPPDWIFRGHSDADWSLETSLERVLKRSDGNLAQADRREKALVRRFQRHASIHLANVPSLENIPDWLALMQHHGAPTRLLDWTHSFFVALFFAVIDQLPGKNAAVWAVNWHQLDVCIPANVKSAFDIDRNVSTRDLFRQICSSGPSVVKLNAFTFHQRLVSQQGTFLFPLDITKSFEENLAVTQAAALPTQIDIYKLIIHEQLRQEILRELFRMNINDASLFPGIDGFARSLKGLLFIPDILHPGTKDHPW